MKALLSYCMLMVVSVVFAQNCKYDRNEIDDFTRQKILVTKAEILSMSGMGYGFSTAVAFSSVDGRKYLRFTISNPNTIVLKQGDKLMFKTDKGEMITLEFPETIVADYRPGTVAGSTISPGIHNLSISIPVDEEMIKRFATETIVKYRVNTAEGPIDEEVKSKRSARIKELTKCI